MSGSVTDNDACGTDWEKWIPQIDSTDDKYHFTWKPPWKNFRIKICSNNKVLDNTSGFLIPLKMQFLITHHVSTVQKIIRNLESSIVQSINSTEELLEIKVKSLEGEDLFTEIERALAGETDDIVMKPIQRLKFTSNLVEELFKRELKEQCIDLMRDEINIFVVGFKHMKSLITKHIDEINRLTATKVVKLGDKWKIEAVKCFGITETLSKIFSDVDVHLQEETSSLYLKGRDVTINKAEKEVHKLLSDLFNEKLLFDPLTLKLLISKETSELFNEILQKEHLHVVWTVDSTHLYSFSKTKVDTDALKAIVYENFLTAGFSKSPQHRNQFCNSNAFIEITKKQNNKLLFLETTMSSVNIAGTKHLILYLLHQEKLFYNDVGNTKEIQVDTLSFEVASIIDEKMKIDEENRELEVKLNDEAQKRKNANDQYQLLERKCKDGEEKLKRITLEKELLIKESRDKEANFIKQLEELKKLNDKQKQNTRTSSDTKSKPMSEIFLQQRQTQPSGCQQPYFRNPTEDGGIEKEIDIDTFNRHAIYEENIQLTRSELRLLQEQYQTEIITLKEQFTKDNVTLNIDNIRILIQGNTEGVKHAKQKIDLILQSIYVKKSTMKKTGIVKHMTSDQGQTKICQVEKRNKVVVLLQTGEDSDDEDHRGPAQPISQRKTCTETAMCKIPSGQTIITVVGDITELEVDVIVNAATKDLQHVGGLAKVIVDKGGKSIQKECDDYLRSKNRAKTMHEGEIFCSSPGILNCKMIVHAVAPVWQNGRSSEEEYLSECIQASLEKTENKKYRSIAIPALCTGVFGYPANTATKVIIEAIRDYMRENGATSPVRQIYLCDVKEDIVDHFVSALGRYFNKANIRMEVGNPGVVRITSLRSMPDQRRSGGWQQRDLPDNIQGSVDIGDLTLKVYQGDLTEATVDVIVNGTNKELDLTRGSVSQAILEKGGRELSQLLSVPAAKKEMRYEGVATTTAGRNFSCDFIIHINMEDSHVDLKAKFKTVLEKVDELNKTSVALPALGVTKGYSIDKIAENLFEALVRFQRMTTDISKVHVVISEKDKVSQFLSAMRNCLETHSNQTQGLFSKFKGFFFGYGEKKAVSTKELTLTKMPSSVLNCVVYAKKQNDADSALRSLEESLIHDYKEKLVEDTLIKELSKDQEAKIMKLEETCEVEIEFNRRIGRIKVKGWIENLSEAMDEVHKMLRDVDVVQWYFISVEETGQILQKYPRDVNLILERDLKNSDKTSILDSSGNRYNVDFNTYTEFPQDDPSDTVAVLRKTKLTDCAFYMPPNWVSMDQNENIKIILLQPSDKEYQDVVQDFKTNMAGNYNSIIKIEKIQNRNLQQQYAARSNSMHYIDARGTNNERKLWHGTAKESVDYINTYGFNRSYCGKNAVAYGYGVYFAVNPTYSAQAQYARPDSNGNKRMYMCKVLVGEYAKGQGGMTLPPPKPGAGGGHILYDSVVDNPQSPGIFVIFDDSQAYPEYLMVFK